MLDLSPFATAAVPPCSANPEPPPSDAKLEAVLARHRDLQVNVSRYIETLLQELVVMAQAAELSYLVHFLELTRQEAGDEAQRRIPVG